MGNGWKWDRDDIRQEGSVAVLKKKHLPVARARAFARYEFSVRVRADLARCQRYAETRDDERRHRRSIPGELLDVPDMLRRLDGIERDIIRMRYWEELEFRAIGARLR